MITKPTDSTMSESRLKTACVRVDALNDEIIRLGLSRLIYAGVDDQSVNIPLIYVADNADYMGDSATYIQPVETLLALEQLPVGTTVGEFWGAIVRA